MLSGRFSWILFGCVCVIVFVMTAPRVWALRALYVDADVRTATRVAVEQVADRHNWLLSDIEIRSIVSPWLLIHHRTHVRGPDATKCLVIHLTSYEETSCGDSF